MTGKLFIDGLDAYTQYGVSLAKGAYEVIVCHPPLKDVEVNEWHEYDGIEADLSSPKLDSRTLSIPFVCNDWYETGAMYELLADGAFHTFLFTELALTLSLRLVAQNSVKTLKWLQMFTLNFADDFPLNGFVYSEPIESDFIDGYVLDEKDFGSFGIRVQNGTLEEVYRLPAVKENKLVNIKSNDGVIYDGQAVKFKAKDVKLSLLMRSVDIGTFWKNYNAFLFMLVLPNERNLYVSDTEESFACYYKESEVTEMHILSNGRIWCKFSVTLVFTSFRLGTFDILLAEQQGGLITDQSSENFINLG